MQRDLAVQGVPQTHTHLFNLWFFVGKPPPNILLSVNTTIPKKSKINYLLGNFFAKRKKPSNVTLT